MLKISLSWVFSFHSKMLGRFRYLHIAAKMGSLLCFVSLRYEKSLFIPSPSTKFEKYSLNESTRFCSSQIILLSISKVIFCLFIDLSVNNGFTLLQNVLMSVRKFAWRFLIFGPIPVVAVKFHNVYDYTIVRHLWQVSENHKPRVHPSHVREIG